MEVILFYPQLLISDDLKVNLKPHCVVWVSWDRVHFLPSAMFWI